MRRTLLVLAVALLAVPAFAHDHGSHRGMSITINDDFGDVIDCTGLKVSFDGDRVPVTSETIPASGVRSLRVQTSKNGGGVRVTGSGGGGYGIRLCKAVAPGVDAGDIRATLRGDELTAEGPEGRNWVAYFLIDMPRGATIDVEASNGPISFDSVDGKVTAVAKNGPISVKDSTGDLDISTTNGPISLAGGSGDVKLAAKNGPLSVKLAGGQWNGTLDASTQNGPLTVKLPRGYRSGVVVEAKGHGPVTCRAEGCWERGTSARSRRNSDDDDDSDWDRDRRFELGSGPQNVRLSTVNGPLSIREVD